MTVRIPGEAEVLREVSEVLVQRLSPAKVVRFWASWQAGRGGYLAWREDRFKEETVATFHEKIQAYQESLPAGSESG